MNTAVPSYTADRGYTTVGLCFLVALLEGFDLQATGLAAPGIASAFKLQPAQMGWMFSAGLLGLLPGAFVGGWLGDKFGRKNVLLVSVLLFGVFSLATAYAWDYSSLLGARLFAGLGLGAALPLLIALSSEAVAENFRSTAVSIAYCGVPLGGVLASLVSMLNAPAEWRLLFYIGGIAPLVVLPLLVAYLTESKAFGALGQRTGDAERKLGIGDLFAGRYLGATLLLWVSCFFTLTVLYMLLNWLPSLLVGKGLSRSQAGTVQLLFNLGGALGPYLTGLLLDRARPRTSLAIVYPGLLVSLALLALYDSFGVTIAAGFFAGYCALGAQLVLYSLAPKLYPTSIRATGVGTMVGVGRLGSISGPLIAGQLLAAGYGASGVMGASAPGLLIAAWGALALLKRKAA
jgi:AAHS family 3-hydroxyphenylpropionic acid transporter